MDDESSDLRSIFRPVEEAPPELLRTHPAEVFGKLLEESPVHRGKGRNFGNFTFPRIWPDFEGDTYLVLSFDGNIELFRHPGVSSDIHESGAERIVGRSLFCMDPPEHTTVRSLLLAGFTPGSMRRMEESAIVPAIESVIDNVATKSRFDLVCDVVASFPYLVMCNVLGLPSDAEQWAMDRAVDMVRAITDPEAAARASSDLGTYLAEFVAKKRDSPNDDFISVLCNANLEDGRQLRDDELVNFIRHLFLAGSETTFRVAGSLMAHVLGQPEIWKQILAEPSLIPNAIEETLRLEPPANYFPRLAKMDIEVEGVTIPKGSIVFGAISAANRDPDRWPNPDIFDLHRERKPTLSFGAGPHTCIGMHLAKRELTLFLEILTRRLPSIRLDPDEPKPIIEGWMLRGVGRLPVVCD